MSRQAIALLELESIAVGFTVGDAMVKRAPVELLCAGTVHPGKYLVLVAGEVAAVEEAYVAGLAAGAAALLDHVLLPGAHPELLQRLYGGRGRPRDVALGVVETRTAAAVVGAADRALKGAVVSLLEIRLADRLGGKAYCVLSGELADVEAAVELAVGGLRDPQQLVAQVVIPRLHAEMLANLEGAGEFTMRLAAAGSGD